MKNKNLKTKGRAILLISVMSMAMLTGCGNNDEAADAEVESQEVLDADIEETAEKTAEELEVVVEREPDLYYGYVHYVEASEGIEGCVFIEPFWDYFLNAPIILTINEAKDYGIDVDGIMEAESEAGGYVYDTVVEFKAHIENYATFSETITVSDVKVSGATEPEYDLTTIEDAEIIETLVFLQIDPEQPYQITEDGETEYIDYVTIYTDFSFTGLTLLNVLEEKYGITEEMIQENPFYTCNYYVVNGDTDFACYQPADFVAYEGEIPYESIEDTITIMTAEFEVDGEIEYLTMITSIDGQRYYTETLAFVQNALGKEDVMGEYQIKAYAIPSEDQEGKIYVIGEFIQ